MSKLKPLARQHEILIQEIDDEMLIYDLRGDKAFSLNSTSALVWQNCNGNNSVDEIAKKMSVELNESVSEDLVWLALERLKKEKLIEGKIATPFAGVSRREAIRRVGTASLIALPIIGTLVAPLTAHAQSCTAGTNSRPLGCPCTAISQCQPPASRCCLSSPGAPNNQTCVETGTQISDGGLCANSCSCISNCCSNGLCVSRTVGTGGACTINCQCLNGLCTAGMCN